MADVKALTDSIELLNKSIIKLNQPSDGTILIDLDKYILTPRQIAKQIMAAGATSLNGVPTDPKTIHIIIYGKYMVDGSGKLVDNEISHPECVDHSKGMSDNHPTLKDKIPTMKTAVKNSLAVLQLKSSQLKADFVLFGQQVTAAVTTIAAAATVLPTGSGVPIAISAIQSIIVAFNTLSKSILELLPVLGPLVDIPVLVAATVLDTLLGLIIGILTALNVVIEGAIVAKDTLAPIKKFLGV